MKKIIRNGIILFFLFLFSLWGCDGTTPPINHPPVITSTPVITATVNVPYSYDVHATDSDGDVLTYSLVTTVQGMTIDPATGLISWTPTQEASTSVTVEVTDGEYTDSQDFVITFQVTPPTVQPVQNITQGTGYATIQAALDAAQSGDTIRVSDGLYPESLTFPAGRVIILQSVNGPASTHIEGPLDAPAITCNGSPGGTEIKGFHIAHAAGKDGCGIYHTNGSIVVSNCHIDHHTSALTGGGGIRNLKATMFISGCTISDNLSLWSGGGILNDQGTVTVKEGSIVTNNHAVFFGGGIGNDKGTFIIEGSTVSQNSVDGNGGGVENYDGSLYIDESTVSENTALGDGGGVYNDQGELHLHEALISKNSTPGEGGGVYNHYDDILTITGGTISENTAEYNGGGIYNGGILTITGGTISKNSGDNGGGILNDLGTITVTAGSTITQNSSDGNGGGIYNYKGNVTITGNTISENSAGYSGGGILNYYGNLTITGSTISKNTTLLGIVSIDTGGGIDNFYGILTITGSTISENSAVVDGGGIHIYPDVSPAIHIIGGSSASDTANFNSFTNNKLGDTISSAQHIRSYNSGDVHGSFPNNYYTPQ